MRWAWPSLLLISLVGCRRADSVERAPSAPLVRIIDDSGRRIRLSKAALRIASLSPSNTEILWAVGCGDRVVVRDRASDFPPAASKLPATDAFRLAADHVAGYRPDLVLVSHADAARIKSFERIGLPVAILEPRTIEQVLANITAVGDLCGAPARAAELVAQLRSRLEKIAQKKKRQLTVYVEIDGADRSRPWTAGRGSFVNRLLELAGGRNIITSERAFLQVNAEAILRADPEVILLATTGSKGPDKQWRAALKRRPGWQQLRALREDRIIDYIDGAILTRPGPRLFDGLDALLAALRRLEPARVAK